MWPWQCCFNEKNEAIKAKQVLILSTPLCAKEINSKEISSGLYKIYKLPFKIGKGGTVIGECDSVCIYNSFNMYIETLRYVDFVKILTVSTAWQNLFQNTNDNIRYLPVQLTG